MSVYPFIELSILAVTDGLGRKAIVKNVREATGSNPQRVK